MPTRSFDTVRRLKQVYANGELALILGAGISLGCRLPDWTELLVRVGKRVDSRRGRSLVHKLQDCGFSLPTIASVLESMVGVAEFDEVLRDCLYERFRLYRRGDSPENRKALLRIVRQGNPTLAAVGAFCAQYKYDNFSPNPLVKGIANTNFDALLTNYVQARYGESLLRTIERAAARRSRHRIPVYHLHGFLQFWEDRLNEGLPGAPETRVLTEQDFFNRYNAPTSVFTYTMLFLLREFSVLFIGASLKDDNMRRLLHYSTQERTRDYEAKRGNVPEEKVRRHFAIMERPRPAVESAIERSLARLGVRPIWVSKVEEIPDLLGEVYGSTGEPWDHVYP
jgi:hypothetical protein